MQTRVNEDKNVGTTTQDRKTDQDVLRELDAQIAEKIMGWVPVEGQTALAPYAYRRPDGHIVHPYSAPEYSTRIEAAMEVLEKMGHAHGNTIMGHIGMATLTIHQYPNGQWFVHFVGKGKAAGETLPEAICRAGLEATKNRLNLE